MSSDSGGKSSSKALVELELVNSVNSFFGVTAANDSKCWACAGAASAMHVGKNPAAVLDVVSEIPDFAHNGIRKVVSLCHACSHWMFAVGFQVQQMYWRETHLRPPSCQLRWKCMLTLGFSRFVFYLAEVPDAGGAAFIPVSEKPAFKPRTWLIVCCFWGAIAFVLLLISSRSSNSSQVLLIELVLRHFN